MKTKRTPPSFAVGQVWRHCAQGTGPETFWGVTDIVSGKATHWIRLAQLDMQMEPIPEGRTKVTGPTQMATRNWTLTRNAA